MRASLLLALLLAPAARAFETPGFELVYSYPAETSLQERDLRQARDVWPEMFDAARATIDVNEFYATPKPADEGKGADPLEASLAALERAAKRGVKIRVMLEKKFEKQSADGIARLKAIPGLDLRVVEWSRLNGAGIIHAKYFVVDGKTAYVGSQNFDWRSLQHIHELGLRVTDAAVVAQVASVFEHDWALSRAEGPAPRGTPADPSSYRGRRAYLVASPAALDPADVGDSQRELVDLIASATATLRIQLLDYNPTTFGRPKRYYAPIDAALRDAAVRGVKVSLLVSHWNLEKPAVDHLKSLALVPGIEVRVITIPEAAAGPIPFARTAHSKYAVLDGKTLWLGTSNWSGGYMDDSRNLEVVVGDPELAGRAAAVHEHLWASPYAAPLEVLKAYPKPRR